jgi:hypothetical protein
LCLYGEQPLDNRSRFGCRRSNQQLRREPLSDDIGRLAGHDVSLLIED